MPVLFSFFHRIVPSSSQLHLKTQTIEDCFRHQMRVDDASVLLEIIDTAGQEEFVFFLFFLTKKAKKQPLFKQQPTNRYSSLRDQYYAKGQGFMLVYSVIVRTTFDSIVDYQARIQRAKQSSAFPLVLVGNKADLADARKVATREGQDLARNFKCPFFETSGLWLPLFQTFLSLLFTVVQRQH